MNDLHFFFFLLSFFLFFFLNRLIAEELDEREIKHLKEAFDQYDTDGDGSISIAEMKNALKGGGKKMPHIDQNFLDKLDIDGDGQIDYHEFLVATMRTKHCKKC